MTLPNPPCEQCTAVCCKQKYLTGLNYGLHEFAVEILVEEEHLFPEAVSHPEPYDQSRKVLPYIAGKCMFLQDDRCSIYDRRPKCCQTFNCLSFWKSRPSGDHGSFLDDHPEVVDLITELRLRS